MSQISRTFHILDWTEPMANANTCHKPNGNTFSYYLYHNMLYYSNRNEWILMTNTKFVYRKIDKTLLYQLKLSFSWRRKQQRITMSCYWVLPSCWYLLGSTPWQEYRYLNLPWIIKIVILPYCRPWYLDLLQLRVAEVTLTDSMGMVTFVLRSIMLFSRVCHGLDHP